MLELARELEQKYGPDQSRIVFDFGDGWTVRKLETMDDQKREGIFMENCLEQHPLDPNIYSLRDELNVPHCDFGVLRVSPEDLDEIREIERLKREDRVARRLLLCAIFVQAGEAGIAIAQNPSPDCRQPLDPERLRQIRTYLENGDPKTWLSFPAKGDAVDTSQGLVAGLITQHVRITVPQVKHRIGRALGRDV
jgi:hypothetical protein